MVSGNRRPACHRTEATARVTDLPAPQLADEPFAEADAVDSRGVQRRLIGLGVSAIALASLLLSVPELRDAVRDIGQMRPGWIAAAVTLEAASCAAFVVIFRAFFPTVPGPLARRVAWAETGSGALLPGGGLTGYALGGVLLHRAGLDRRRIVILSGGLFWLTSAVNAAAVTTGALMLTTGVSAGPRDFAHVDLPLIAALASTAMVVLLALRARNARRGWQTALGEGVAQAARTARQPSWRLLGAVGYLGFDIAVLWCSFRALGWTPPPGALMLGYLLGYITTMIPIPGGLGVLDGGLAGVLVLYGTPATKTIAAVLVYHAIAFLIPLFGGLLAYLQLRRPLAAAKRTRPSTARLGHSPKRNRTAVPSLTASASLDSRRTADHSAGGKRPV
jgi:uncharacterized membrane protein YbhN (UPF0104 family)